MLKYSKAKIQCETLKVAYLKKVAGPSIQHPHRIRFEVCKFKYASFCFLSASTIIS